MSTGSGPSDHPAGRPPGGPPHARSGFDGLALGHPLSVVDPSRPSEDTVPSSSVDAPVALQLPFSASSVSVARQQLMAWMRSRGASPEAVEDARVIISELVANALRHATPMADGTLGVSWSLERDALEVSVTDGGGATSPRHVRASATQLTGRGMAIIDALAHEWWSERVDTRTTVHVLMPL